MIPTTQEIENIIRKFIETNFPETDRQSLLDSQALLASQIVDSLGIIKLITFIEQEFDITVEDEDIVPQNFQSISAIVTLVETKMI